MRNWLIRRRVAALIGGLMGKIAAASQPAPRYFNKLRISASVTISVMGSLGEASKPNAR